MTTCPCDLPGSERRIFLCVRLGCRMTPHFCHLYQTNDSYRNAWNEGRGPGQRLAVPKQTTHKRRYKVAGIDVPEIPEQSAGTRDRLIQALIIWTKSVHIVENQPLYYRLLDAWAAVECEVRDTDDQKFILSLCRKCIVGKACPQSYITSWPLRK